MGTHILRLMVEGWLNTEKKEEEKRNEIIQTNAEGKKERKKQKEKLIRNSRKRGNTTII